MTWTEFEKELRRLEEKHWKYGGEIKCADSGGDHNAERWVNPKEEIQQAEVCRQCGYVKYQ